MASPEHGGPGEEWRLGIELAEAHEHPPEPADALVANLSDARLNRPLQVVTVEHLGWFAVATWAVITRLIAIGARPLTANEAARALFEYDRAFGAHEATSHPAWSGWLHLAQTGVFVIVGANDVTARLISVLAGLLIVAMAFEMRHYLGRAGALALAALWATSPTVTYFSRASEPIVTAAALSIVALALYMALIHRPGAPRAAVFGCAGGLMVAADPTGAATAVILLTALAGLGLRELVAARNVYLRIRVWIDRYSTLIAIVIVSGATTFVLSELVLFDGTQLPPILDVLRPLWGGDGKFGYDYGLRFYLPAVAFYEFLIALATLAGALAIIARRVPTRFAFFCLLWTIASVTYYLWIPRRDLAGIIQMIIPASFVGALLIDYLHHTYVWRFARYPIATLVLLTIYVQVLSNFVYSSPDAAEAPWARHANLYWRTGTTTVQTRERIAEALKDVMPADATVFLNGEWPPALRWYLRTLRSASNPDSAALTIDLAPVPNVSTTADQFQFDYELDWQPQFTATEPSVLWRYFLTARTWGNVDTRTVGILARPSGAAAPTMILPP